MTKRRRVDPADLEKVVSIHEALSRDLTEAEAQLKRAGCVVAELERERAVLLKYLPLSSNDRADTLARLTGDPPCPSKFTAVLGFPEPTLIPWGLVEGHRGRHGYCAEWGDDPDSSLPMAGER